ncbi:MAG: tyrosine-type recombinase/integrase [Anaerobutyricum soehngenii]
MRHFLPLYYTGMRIGELQALTLADLDLENGIIHINKTYAIISGQEIITTPKTTKSVREIAYILLSASSKKLT